MIKLATSLSDFDFTDALSVKLRCLAAAYGFGYPFCTFWLQYKNGIATAAVCKFYSAITVAAADNADINELCDFVSVIGYSEIIAPFEPNNCNCRGCTAVFAATKNISLNFQAQMPKIDDCKAAYGILANNGGDAVKMGSFDDWYVDINHRVRHNAARLVLANHTAAVILCDGKNAYLNGIAVEKAERGCGNATRTLSSISGNDGKLFVLCRESERGFYEKCGFVFYGKYFCCTDF